ncbi:MAG: FeoB small GTPase domain-containing protein, partial [Pseudomonadota bacterium]
MSEFKLALVGAPNCGKSTLFNGLTGGRAKVANYAGATVETRSGRFSTSTGHQVELIDLPGFYGMTARSLDEKIALNVVMGHEGVRPDALLVLMDASNIRTHLHSVLQLKSLGQPMILSLNMMDLAERAGLEIDIDALEEQLGLPVVSSRATRKAGRDQLLSRLDEMLSRPLPQTEENTDLKPIRELQAEARAIANQVITKEPLYNKVTRSIDQVVMHPLAGPLILASLLFFVFQAVFSWAALPMDMIDAAAAGLGDLASSYLPQGWIRDLVVDGIIAGVGSVIIFLPQIVILFTFILLLEASGYMSRAAFLMD